jgi:hypothetical protein
MLTWQTKHRGTPTPSIHRKSIEPLLVAGLRIDRQCDSAGNHQPPIYRMTKTELLVQISELLDKSIELYEVIDLKLEESDSGSLQTMHIFLDTAIEYLRKTRRTGRVVFNEYEDEGGEIVRLDYAVFVKLAAIVATNVKTMRQVLTNLPPSPERTEPPNQLPHLDLSAMRIH